MSPMADYSHPEPVQRLLLSMVPAVCPSDATRLGLSESIVGHVELTMRASPKMVRAALLAGLSGYELASMAVPSHLGKRASQLSIQQATRYFASWYHSSIPPQHEFAKGVKGLLCLACYEQDAMLQHIGYTPKEWIAERIKLRLQTYSVDIEKHQRELLQPDPLPNVPPHNGGPR